MGVKAAGLPWREAIGFGTFVTWHLSLCGSDAGPGVGTTFGTAQLLLFLAAASTAGVVLAAARRPGVMRPVRAATALSAASVLATVATTALGGGRPVWLTAAAAGAACALFEVLWSARIAPLDCLQMQFVLFGGMAVGSLGAFALDWVVVGWLRALLLGVLVAASALALLGRPSGSPASGPARPDGPGAPPSSGPDEPRQDLDREQARRALVRLLLACFVFSFAFYLMRPLVTAPLPSAEVNSWRLWSKVVAAAVLLLFVLLRRPVPVSSLFRVALPVTVAGLALTLFSEPVLPPLGFFALSVGNKLFEVLVWVFVLRVMHAVGDGSLRPAAEWALVKFAAAGAGLLAAVLLLGVLDRGAVQATALVPLAICLVTACFAWLVPERKIDGLFEGCAAPPAAPPQAAGVFGGERDAVERLARSHGLTPRETEVLGLLAQGRSLAVVMERLSISQGTAQSHKTSIYRKMGVHGQQELIDLVRGADDAPPARPDP